MHCNTQGNALTKLNVSRKRSSIIAEKRIFARVKPDERYTLKPEENADTRISMP